LARRHVVESEASFKPALQESLTMARSTDFPRSGAADDATDAPAASAGSRARRERLRRVQPPRSTVPPDDFDEPVEEPRGRSYDEDAMTWRRLGALGAGVAIGVLVGAGIAMLTTPLTGEEARELIGETSRRARRQAVDRWDDLRLELRRAARRGRRAARRGATRGRWAYQDAMDRVWR
jgi:hypothetical protein